MAKPLLLAALICLAHTASATADTLNVLLFPLSGEVRFQNPSASAVPFIYYSITSSTNHAGTLNPTSPPWRSISDYYDASGNGFIDPTNNWSIIQATPIELTEGAFSGPGGSLPAFRTVSLGAAWNPGVVAYTDLAFDIKQETQTITTNIQLAVAGDYNHNGSVDQADYMVWRQSFGSATVLDADGDLNGVVDAADFVVWRKNFGNSLPPGSGSFEGGSSLELGGMGVPEPSAGLLTCLVGLAFLPRVRRQRVLPKKSR